MALATVAEYVAEARRLLQDQTTPYRTATGELQDALGIALYEMRRLRPRAVRSLQRISCQSIVR